MDVSSLLQRFASAKAKRGIWESHWQECYDYALPHGGGFGRGGNPGERKTDRLFDGTAADAVEQLAASLLAQLTPPWSRWFGLMPGPDLSEAERDTVAPLLEKAAATLQSHFDRSNFAVEMHQCYLDLVTAGTACLLFEEAPPGDYSGFRFTAVPLAEAVLEEGADGRLDGTFRRSELTLAQLRLRFPDAAIGPAMEREAAQDPQARFGVVEAVLKDGPVYRYTVILDSGIAEDEVLAEGRFARSPFINFRWLKAPGETYGRSPVMKTLPDIKTANKVVELVLKNASIAVTGIWQASDKADYPLLLLPFFFRFPNCGSTAEAIGSGLHPDTERTASLMPTHNGIWPWPSSATCGLTLNVSRAYRRPELEQTLFILLPRPSPPIGNPPALLSQRFSRRRRG